MGGNLFYPDYDYCVRVISALITLNSQNMKSFLLLAGMLLTLHTNATTWTVNVANFQFSSSNLNVKVGDVIHWVWVSGFHTTTSTGVPAGASTWNAAIDNSNTAYDYTVTVAGTYNYVCNFHPGMTASFTASVVAPVVLSSFTISSKNNKPLLLWTTQIEKNTDHFSIRKSLNGTDFTEAGVVPAVGNSISVQNYSYLDEEVSPENKFIYYSLAIIDKDGEKELTPIQVYRNSAALPKLILSLSPNPISGMGHLVLRFNADKKGLMRAKIVDMQGKIILERKLNAHPGVNNGHIHLGDLPRGIYIIHFILEGLHESYRIIRE